jgi:predicted RNA-binding Zn-ribbon protein involved in translation (DUF1610 family)
MSEPTPTPCPHCGWPAIQLRCERLDVSIGSTSLSPLRGLRSWVCANCGADRYPLLAEEVDS